MQDTTKRRQHQEGTFQICKEKRFRPMFSLFSSKNGTGLIGGSVQEQIVQRRNSCNRGLGR